MIQDGKGKIDLKINMNRSNTKCDYTSKALSTMVETSEQLSVLLFSYTHGCTIIISSKNLIIRLLS